LHFSDEEKMDSWLEYPESNYDYETYETYDFL